MLRIYARGGPKKESLNTTSPRWEAGAGGEGEGGARYVFAENPFLDRRWQAFNVTSHERLWSSYSTAKTMWLF